jgi:hypothetical protein
MIRCGRDADMRSGHRGRRQTQIVCEVMIIVESSLPKTVASTRSNCAKGMRVRTIGF